MNLLPNLEKNIWTFKATFASWLFRNSVQPTIIFASKNRLMLSLFYAGASRKRSVVGCFTTGREVLEALQKKPVGILICTLDLDEGDGFGDFVIAHARQIQPSLRCVLLINRDNDISTDALPWQSPVIIAAEDINDDSQPFRMAMLSAIANTSFRSKSIPSTSENSVSLGTIKLTKREQQMLECFALGLTNAQAAEHLKLSPQSTKTYSRDLLSKLQVSNRQLALITAHARGLFKSI
jgi:DNA-binding NarL/FixJ family response regulator